MRALRKTMLLVMAIIVAMAMVTAVASAQNLELEDEPDQGGPHTDCPAVSISGTDVNGGCLVHAKSEAAGVELRKHVFGIESHIGRCVMEFHGRADADAEGALLEQVLAPPPSGTCARQACKDVNGESLPWLLHGNEGLAVEGTEYATVNFCVEPVGGGTDETCEVDLPFNKLAGVHQYEIGHATEVASHGISGFRCEFVAHWTTESGGVHDGQNEDEVEMNHVV